MGVSFYDVVGFLSAATVVLSLGGIVAQLRRIYRRKAEFAAGTLDGERPTEVLSLNRFSCSFLAFFSMLLYAMTMKDMNVYIGAPRAVAVFLLLIVLYEMQHDRRDVRSRLTFGLCVGFVIAAVAFCFTPYRSVLSASGVSQAIVIIASAVFLQGVVHQIAIIRKTGKTGALSKGMYQLFFLKDVFSLIFGAMLGFEAGWPVILMHVLSGCAQLTTLYHFAWVQRSPVAQQRRGLAA